MALMLSEIYDALIEAGASEDKARKAAEAVAAYENRLYSIERKIDHLAIELRVYAGILVSIGLTAIFKFWK